MDKIKILVAQHKEADVYSNKVYTPIQVGKAVSKVDLGILGDDTGDNISSLNPYYCELTAQYWAWKNPPDVEYIGLCHYRRYFKTEFTEDNIEDEMGNFDIILARRIILKSNILNWYSTGLTPEDVSIFHLFMSRLYEKNIDLYNSFYICRNWINPANVFICRKELFDEFCQWQFAILEALRAIIPLSPYTRCRRLMGYFGESLLPFFVYIKGLRIKEIPLVSMIGNQAELNKQSNYTKIKCDLLFTKGNQIFSLPDDFLVGLEADGIVDKVNNYFNKCD